MKTSNYFKIIIVDDDFFFGSFIKNYLHNQGYSNVELYTDEEEFYHDFVPSSPCLYIVDHHLKTSTGLDLIKKIKQFDSQAKIIYLSGQEYCHIAIKAIRIGVVDYVEKNGGSLKKIRQLVKLIQAYPSISYYEISSPSVFKSSKMGGPDLQAS